MNGESTVRTGIAGLASLEYRLSRRAGRSSRASWRGRLSLSRTSGRRASEWPGSIAWVVAGLAFVIVAAGPHSSGADDSECVLRIVEFEPGKIRLRGTDGTSKKADSSELPERICVLEEVTGRPQYKVSIEGGRWEGVWFIKRRNVMQVEGKGAECPPSIISASVEIRSERVGGVRAIGEEPCKQQVP